MLAKHHTIHLIGSASGLAAGDAGCADGPDVLKKSPFLKEVFHEAGMNVIWDAILHPKTTNMSVLESVTQHCENLARAVSKLTHNKDFFIVFGGDHSGAVGTWSGVYDELKGDLGLIWIDAHMDSHTPETSHSGNIHGMPVACLLGHGTSPLTRILNKHAKIRPEHLCLVGVRSFEPEEKLLLEKLQVKVFYMDEVKERGLAVILKEALAIASQDTAGFGLTIDIDSIDPSEAPGTGVAELNGLSVDELCSALPIFANLKQLIGVEIVEFDPHKDINRKTEKVIAQLIQALLTK